MILSKNEMIALWRSTLGLDAAMPEAALDRDDGLDVDAWLERAARQWYLDALDSAPLSALLAEDASADLTAALEQPDTAVALGMARLPEAWRRVCSVRLFGWQRPVAPVKAAEAPQVLARLASTFAFPGVAEPVALLTDTHLVVAPLVRRQALQCLVVADPGPETYRLHESLLSSIPKTISISNL